MNFLDELKRLDEAATEAPWFAEHVNDDGTIRIDDGRQNGLHSINAECQEAALIVFLRNKAADIAALVSAADRVIHGPHSSTAFIALEAALSRLNGGAK